MVKLFGGMLATYLCRELGLTGVNGGNRELSATSVNSCSKTSPSIKTKPSPTTFKALANPLRANAKLTDSRRYQCGSERHRRER